MGPTPRVGRVSDRASFDALRRGRRGRAGAVLVTYLPAPGGQPAPRVAFEVGRRAGGAVVRNRVRRRLRAALADLHRHRGLPGGTYLVGGGRELADQPWPSLLADVEAAVAEATRPRAAT